MIRVVPATHEHAAYLAPRLRDGDRVEMEAAGMPIADGIERSIDMSFAALCCLVDDEPAAIIGAISPSMIGNTAYMWALTSGACEHVRKSFMVISRAYVLELQYQYPRLEGLVDPNYERAIKWLHWLGFHKDGQMQVKNGRMFDRMVRTA